jgi:hypothetical protein
VKRDGAVVGAAQWGSAIAVDPGEHTVTASAPNRKTWQTTVDVAADANAPLSIAVPDLEPAAPAPPPLATTTTTPPPDDVSRSERPASPLRTVGIAVAGAGAVGVIVGVVFGLRAKSKKDDSSAHCDANNHCDQTGVDLRNDSLSAGTVSTIGFVVGSVALAGGAALFFFSPSHKVSVTSRGVRFEGAF